MAENGNIAYISTDFGQKNEGNGNIILKGQKTEIVDMIVTDVGNYKSNDPSNHYIKVNSTI